MVLDIADAPVRLVRKVPLNVWFRLRRTVEDTSTILLVFSQESNAKTCASLVLRVEREAAEWSGQGQVGTSAAGCSAGKSACATHTPGCLLDGAAHTAEVVRSLAKHKRPQVIDQPSFKNSTEAHARFRLHANPWRTAAEGGPYMSTSIEDLEEEQEERMQNPG